ncbi:YeeE/YedE family protein [Arenicella xantha]|uniref:Uncharacterized protein n=1 Tax=Arenicella xantha TaxID=644221 RepID=A0A395JPQ7_9GAMM|nr:YeeE/YedE thiosulfate transporter family protein [Arenicella xantha]RBP50690.1 hypothetical protein DFR28_102101 [Arenicella xantha]
MNDYLIALLGGGLIGLASVILMASQGAVMGISGIVSRAISRPTSVTAWRLVFIAGVLAAPIVYSLFANNFIALEITENSVLLVIAGLFVGVGTVIGNGCTSGHGVCGLSRLSARSMVATITFMLTAVLTVAAVNYLSGVN